MSIRIDPNAWGNPPHGLVALVHLSIGFAWYLGLGYVRETGRLNRILLSDRRDAIASCASSQRCWLSSPRTTGLVPLAGRYLFGPSGLGSKRAVIIGSMFILWSLTQASALRTTIVETVASRVASTPARRESAPWACIIVVQAFVGSIGWTLTRPHGCPRNSHRRVGPVPRPRTRSAPDARTEGCITRTATHERGASVSPPHGPSCWYRRSLGTSWTALRHPRAHTRGPGFGAPSCSPREVILTIVTILPSESESKTRTLAGLVVTPIRAAVWGSPLGGQGHIGSTWSSRPSSRNHAPCSPADIW